MKKMTGTALLCVALAGCAGGDVEVKQQEIYRVKGMDVCINPTISHDYTNKSATVAIFESSIVICPAEVKERPLALYNGVSVDGKMLLEGTIEAVVEEIEEEIEIGTVDVITDIQQNGQSITTYSYISKASVNVKIDELKSKNGTFIDLSTGECMYQSSTGNIDISCPQPAEPDVLADLF
ncbi:hypothetical protein LMH73_009885 [Vibrio splendidus]|nr:hypothetical protein [Vibrio splendidus]MCC4878465.1 hypothetical protein [Vibrio splendidus]